MKKMEEMMELLTDEIEGFHKSINKLEALSKNFKELEIKADNSSVEYHLKDFLNDQRKAMTVYNERTTEIERRIKSARIIPNWLATLFCIAISIQVLSLSYFGYHHLQFEKSNDAAFLAGKKEINESVKEYFDDHTVIYEDYLKWTRKKDSISNQK